MIRTACLLVYLIQQIKSIDNVNGKLKLLYFTFTFSDNSFWRSTSYGDMAIIWNNTNYCVQ